MVDVEFLEQLVGSMENAVEKLESLINKDKEKNKAEIMKLKVFIFDLHRKLDFSVSDSLNKIKGGYI